MELFKGPKKIIKYEPSSKDEFHEHKKIKSGKKEYNCEQLINDINSFLCKALL